MFAAATPRVIDVDESNFQAEVLDRSRQVPVVVDFWAEWCGPCRTLGPILEGLAQEYGGRFILAKLNVDENQRLAMQYGIQGIPAVKGFRDGRVAAEFVGAQPRPAVRQFIEKLVPNEQDKHVMEGQALLAAGKPDAAEARFKTVLAADAKHPAALLGLAQAELAQGQEQEALATLERVPPATPAGAEASRLRATLALRSAAGGASEADLQARLAAEPADLEARYALGSLLASQERYEQALEQFLEIVRRDKAEHRNKARQAMLHIFELLGEDPLARTYRNRLASLLFA